jgi:hypothetical protein
MGGRLDAEERRLRQQLEWITSRYDGGAMSPAVAATIKTIQCDIAWNTHRGRKENERGTRRQWTNART